MSFNVTNSNNALIFLVIIIIITIKMNGSTETIDLYVRVKKQNLNLNSVKTYRDYCFSCFFLATTSSQNLFINEACARRWKGPHSVFR